MQRKLVTNCHSLDRQGQSRRSPRRRCDGGATKIPLSEKPNARNRGLLQLYARALFINATWRVSVSSSAGNMDSMRSSWAATVCGVPTVVTIEK